MRTALFIQGAFADDYGVRAAGEIAPEFMGNLGKDFAVAFILCLVVNIACLLYPDSTRPGIVLQERKAGTAERKVTRNDSGCLAQ